MEEQDFIRGVVVMESLDGPPQIQHTMSYVRLTAAGYDFLDTIRDESIWRQTQEKLKTVGGGVAISVLVAVANDFLKQKLGLQ